VKKMIIFVLIFISVIMLTVAIFEGYIVFLNPLMRSHEGIRAYMLKFTPIGMSMEDVVKVIEDNDNWRIRETWETGYTLINGRPSFFPRNLPASTGTIIGEKSLRVHIGEYRIFFTTNVSVYYAFDEDSKLIDIAVYKDKDTW